MVFRTDKGCIVHLVMLQRGFLLFSGIVTARIYRTYGFSHVGWSRFSKDMRFKWFLLLWDFFCSSELIVMIRSPQQQIEIVVLNNEKFPNSISKFIIQFLEILSTGSCNVRGIFLVFFVGVNLWSSICFFLIYLLFISSIYHINERKLEGFFIGLINYILGIWGQIQTPYMTQKFIKNGALAKIRFFLNSREYEIFKGNSCKQTTSLLIKNRKMYSLDQTTTRGKLEVEHRRESLRETKP